MCLPVNITNFLGTTFFTEHLRWLLLHLELKYLHLKNICLNFPRTVNKTHTDRAILKFSTQPEKKCFSQAFKSGNCKKKKKIPTHVFLIQLAFLNDFYCMR